MRHASLGIHWNDRIGQRIACCATELMPLCASSDSGHVFKKQVRKAKNFTLTVVNDDVFYRSLLTPTGEGDLEWLPIYQKDDVIYVSHSCLTNNPINSPKTTTKSVWKVKFNMWSFYCFMSLITFLGNSGASVGLQVCLDQSVVRRVELLS